MSLVNQININNVKAYLQHNRRIPWLVTAFFLLLIIGLIWQFGQTIRTNLVEPNKQITQPTPIKRLPNIADFHLFGIFDASLQNLPETQLQLTLQGTVVSPKTKNKSYAIIATPNQPTKIYKISQEVPGGAAIRLILKDRIILDNHGSLAVLRLPVPKPLIPVKSIEG